MCRSFFKGPPKPTPTAGYHFPSDLCKDLIKLPYSFDIDIWIEMIKKKYPNGLVFSPHGSGLHFVYPNVYTYFDGLERQCCAKVIKNGEQIYLYQHNQGNFIVDINDYAKLMELIAKYPLLDKFFKETHSNIHKAALITHTKPSELPHQKGIRFQDTDFPESPPVHFTQSFTLNFDEEKQPHELIFYAGSEQGTIAVRSEEDIRKINVLIHSFRESKTDTLKQLGWKKVVLLPEINYRVQNAAPPPFKESKEGDLVFTQGKILRFRDLKGKLEEVNYFVAETECGHIGVANEKNKDLLEKFIREFPEEAIKLRMNRIIVNMSLQVEEEAVPVVLLPRSLRL